MVVLRRWPSPARDPIENVGVGAVEQCLVAIELAVIEPGEVGIGKTAKDQVAFSCPAVPGTEQQPLAADLRWCGHFVPLAVPLAGI